MNNLALPIKVNIFDPCINNFNFKNFQEIATERKNTVKCGLQTVTYRCPQLWILCSKHYEKLVLIERICFEN